ncbi:GEM-like protein 5 [Salvia divinorum]|uniref:GEM-like protein 5 n=1 Tax=Salvia divinorum TaxID=28513 RepID=A0ABD1I9G3_SALDI
MDQKETDKPEHQAEGETKKWGTHIMGAPAAPAVHPDNQQAALWQAAEEGPQQYYQIQQPQQPYVVLAPVERSAADSPLDHVVNIFNSWSHRAEEIARNVWHNLKTGPSVSGAAWGKVNLTAKAITEGGFESLFKQTFETDADEKLKKTFACYLSTTTGPVAGTLYLSTARVAFCSDRPLSFRAPSGQETWAYYKVTIPLRHVHNVAPVVLKQNPPEKYIHLVTVAGHEFWFMGFVNFEKASHYLLDSVSDYRSALQQQHVPS